MGIVWSAIVFVPVRPLPLAIFAIIALVVAVTRIHAPALLPLVV